MLLITLSGAFLKGKKNGDIAVPLICLQPESLS